MSVSAAQIVDIFAQVVARDSSITSSQIIDVFAQFAEKSKRNSQNRDKSYGEYIFEALHNTTKKPGSLKFLSAEFVEKKEVNPYGTQLICCLRGEIDSSDFYDFFLPVEWVEDAENKKFYSEMLSNAAKEQSFEKSPSFCYFNCAEFADKHTFLPGEVKNLKDIIPDGRRLRFQFYNNVGFIDNVGHFFFEF